MDKQSVTDAVFQEAKRLSEAPPPLSGRVEMPFDAVVEYARTAPVEHIRCRAGARHRYPYVVPSKRVYVHTTDGYDIYRVDCEVCGEAYSEEVWFFKVDARGIVGTCRRISKRTRYHDAKGGGRSEYLLPKGAGAIRGSQLEELHVSMGMAGHPLRQRFEEAS